MSVPEGRPTVASATSLAGCDQEPIHIPGAIQPHGAVLAARLEDLLVTHVSANLADILGVPPDAALGHPLSATPGEAACGVLRDKSTQSHPGHVDSLA
ncbi:phytochrome family protein [Rhodopila globiformis]|uniref:PAS fold-2 domain-containing protein n=1 Tax=Rhodopila globiformis TaxID=1071 RepID=A0A2S6NGW0_RHOGL|nr:hypothetical protein CCS01_13140 [Rhodopila globiformis]